jgi:hypothetical protein
MKKNYWTMQINNLWTIWSTTEIVNDAEDWMSEAVEEDAGVDDDIDEVA